MRILGVDPGSRLTGYGCIDVAPGGGVAHVAHGTLTLARTGGRQETPLETRLHLLYQGLSEVIQRTRPEVLVVEKVFFAKNAVSALKLGQARGAVILTGMIHTLAIVEYSPSEVKQAVVGTGGADKEQVARMVELVLGKLEFATFDASDGLALAICHANVARQALRSRGPSATAGSAALAYAQALRSAGGKRKKSGSSLADALGLAASEVAGASRISARKLRQKP